MPIDPVPPVIFISLLFSAIKSPWGSVAFVEAFFKKIPTELSLVSSIIPLFFTVNGVAVFIADTSPYIPIDCSSCNFIVEVALVFSSVVTSFPYIPTASWPCIVIEPLLNPSLPLSFVYIPIAPCVLVDTIAPSFIAVEPLPAVVVPSTPAKATCVFVVNFFPVVNLTSALFAANKAIVELAAPWVIV